MFQMSLLNDDQVEPLADGVLAVLEQVGILCQNEELLTALRQAGATVDFAAQRARFPRRMVQEFVEQFRAEHAGAEPQAARFQPPPLPAMETQIAQHIYDHAARQKRSGNTRDFITCIQLGDVLHRERGVGHALLSTDVPPLLEPLNAALLLAEYAHHPTGVYPWNVGQIDYLLEMAAILGVSDLWVWGALCFAHPLRLDREVVNRMVRMAKAGVPVGITAMPVAGVSTPVTVEGFIAVAAAEVVAVWIAARALNPQVPLGGSMWAGTVDMKTGGVSYSAFDAMHYAFAVCEFLRRWTGVSFPPGSGEYADAKVPGLYAAQEKHYKAMAVAAFTGRHPGAGQGMLECGKVLAPVQMMIERDFAAALGRYGQPLAPTAENLALPTILEVDLGLHTNFLQSEHTLRHFREALWLPQLVDRSGYAGPAQDEALLDRAQAQVDEALAQYVKPDGREDALEQMRAVMKRAEKQL